MSLLKDWCIIAKTYYNGKGGTKKLILEFNNNLMLVVGSIVFSVYFYSFFCYYTILAATVVALTLCALFLVSKNEKSANIGMGILNNRYRVLFAVMVLLAFLGLSIEVSSIQFGNECVDSREFGFVALAEGGLGGLVNAQSNMQMMIANSEQMLLYYQLFISLWALYHAWVAVNIKKAGWTIPLLIIFIVYLPFIPFAFKYEWYAVMFFMFIVVLSIPKMCIPGNMSKTDAFSGLNILHTLINRTKEVSTEDQLRSFAKLRDDGIISSEEFDQKKKHILGL